MLHWVMLGSVGVMSLGGFKSGTHNHLIFVLRALVIAPRACSDVCSHRKCPKERSCSRTQTAMVTVQHISNLSSSLWVAITYSGDKLRLDQWKMNALTPCPVQKIDHFQRKPWKHIKPKLSKQRYHVDIFWVNQLTKLFWNYNSEYQQRLLEWYFNVLFL